ncbi:MAG TPA: cobalamin B12-binding domain-containing protein [Candidatus Krumholzibacteria bacterium]
MDCAALEKLVSEDRSQAPSDALVLTSVRETSDRSEQYLERAVEAIETLDRHRLYRILGDASVEMSGPEFRHQLVVPLLATIGARWQEGSLRIVHEHMATHVIRSFLTIPRSRGDRSRAPRMVITTPPGQYHEIGALMAAAVAEEMGWDVFYLGTSLPAEEIAAAVRQTGARAVALSLCYRESDSHVLDEMLRLRTLVDSDIPVFVGGNAVHALRERFVDAGITCPEDLAGFRAALQTALTV